MGCDERLQGSGAGDLDALRQRLQELGLPAPIRAAWRMSGA